MKAIRIDEFGGPDVLISTTVPRPEPGPDDILVRVEAAGVNFIDVYHRTGQYEMALPIVPGVEGAGEVAAVGLDVTRFERGDRVAYAMEMGAYAEYAVVPAERAVRVPEAIDTRQAAAVMLQGMTAHYLTHSTYALQANEVALIHAASGGVGSLLVQLAKLHGAHVIGTTSTEEKARRAGELGADEMILYTELDFEQEVQRITLGKGVDVVYDGVGKATFRKGLNCLKRRGMMVLYGQASGAVDPIDPQVLKEKGSLYLTRPSLSHYAATREELERRTEQLFEWMEAGLLQVRIDRMFPLEEAAEAHRYIENRKTQGKLLLIPQDGAV
jgi:NADPH2:quinone reductase